MTALFRQNGFLIVCLALCMGAASTALGAKADVPDEIWHAYIRVAVSKVGAGTTYLFSSVGPMGRAATEQCLDSEVAIYVNMTECAARNGDDTAKQCREAARSGGNQLYAKLDEVRKSDPSIPMVQLSVDCVGSRNEFVFDEAKLRDAATKLVAKELPKNGVVVSEASVLDDHFKHWTLESCEVGKKRKRLHEECTAVLQNVTIKNASGPFLTRAQREQRVKQREAEAESAREESVKASRPITGAFGMQFGAPTRLSWKPADVNAMINLPLAPPVHADNRRGWVTFVPTNPPEVFAGLKNVRYLALLRAGLIPINISVQAAPTGDCSEFKRALEEGIAKAYGRDRQESAFTDGKNYILTKCDPGRFSMSYIDVDGYKTHNDDLTAEAAGARRTVSDSAAKDL